MGVKVKMNFDKRSLEDAIKSQASEALQNRSYDVECPHCHKNFDAQPGINICPHCRNEVNLNLDIKF